MPNELYNKLKEKKLYTNSESDFITKYGSEQGQVNLYNKLFEKRLYTNDLNSFKSKYFSSSTPAQQSQYTPEQLSGYKWSDTITQSPSISTPTENVNVGITGNTQLKPKSFSEIMPKSLFQHIAERFLPSKEAEKTVIKDLTTVEKATPSLLTPEAQVQKNTDDVINAFTDFRNIVPNTDIPEVNYALQDDLFKTGFVPTKLQTPEGKEYTKLEFKPQGIEQLDAQTNQFIKQYELKVKEINAKYDKLQYDVESKFGNPNDDSDASTIMYNTKDEVKKIREAKQKELNAVNKAWGKLNGLLQNKALEAKENHLDKFTSIDLEDKNIEGISETFKESNKYFKSLTQQTEADRKRYSGDLAIDVETLGNPEERIKRKEYRDVSDKVDPSLLSVLPIKKQGEEYYGTKLQIDKNERDLDVVLQQKAGLQKQYTEYKKGIDDVLKDLAAKGLTLNNLTSESRNQILKAQEDLGKFENAIKDADENIALRKQYSEQLFSDVSSLKDFITYKSEKEKLRRLYEDSPWATTAVEIGSYLTKDLVKTTGKMLSQSKVLYGRNDLNEQDKQDYLTKIAESTEFTPKVEIDYEGKYTPLKDVSAIQMFDKEGNLDLKLHPQALFFQTGKTAGEMIYIASPAGLLRRGALTLGGKALAKEIAIREAVAATEIGTTFGEKAALKGLQAVEWTGRTTSLVPSTYVLFSPEMIDQELKKGLSTSDIKTAVNLRIAAESLSENLLLDDVKFLDNLLKKGEIRTYEQLMKSDAYRTIMDNLSLKVAGKKLSELEYKALFDPKILAKFVKVTGDKIAPYAVGAARGLSVQAEESGEEVSSNFFNVLIDTYIASKNPNYEKGEEFTIENQVNTVLQTMATMIPMGVSQAVKSYKEEQADRTYGMNLSAYQVAITPKVFQENLLEQYKESQRTKNPMSKEELTVRMAELDKFGKIYESLGFSKDNEKEALQNEIQSITTELGKDEKFKDKIPTLEYEIQKQAERNLRNREFEAFSAALKKNEYENEFLNAKTDKEKEILFEKIEEKLLDVEKLKEKRQEDKKKVEEAKQKEREQYNQSFQETIDILEQNNNNIDEYLNQFEDLNSLNQELETLSQLKEHPDERIKNLSTSLYTELNNKLYQLSEETVEDPTTFSKTEQEFISQLPVNPEDVTKTEDGIVVNIDGEQVLFSSLKEIQDVFNQKDEKTEKALKYQRAIDDLEILQQEIPIPDGIQIYYSNNKGKFAIDVSGEETIEFDTIDEVKEYLLNPTPKEDVQQTNLAKFNNEIDSLYEEYKASKKKPASKESWLNQEGTKKKIKKLRDKYGIKQPVETKQVTESPIEIKEFTDEQILETNSISNLETLSSNGIIYEGYKLVNASGLLAYQSRGFEETEDKTFTQIIENVNELNKEFLFLLFPNFNVGEEFTIVVKPVSDSNFIEQEKEELRNNARFLIEQGISQEEITSDLENDENFREIQVFTKDGKYAGTIHSLSYIRPKRVVDYLEDEYGNKIPNLAPNYKQLKQLRESLIANEKDVTLKLTSKNSGWLSIKYQEEQVENSPLSESFENKEALGTIQVMSKTSTTRFKGKESLNEAKSGATVLSIVTPNNQVFALSLQKRKLKTLEVSTISDSISLHVEYNRLLSLESTPEIKETLKYLEDFANNISEDYNILTPEGLKQYIQLFVHANSKTSDFKNKAKREGTENIPFIDVDITDRGDFRITFSNSRTFEAEMDTELNEVQLNQAMGIYRFTLSELKDKGTFNKFSALFKEHLLNRTINHSTELSNTTAKFKIPFIKATKSKTKPFIKVEETELEQEGLTSQYKSYKDFLIETSLTPIIETKLPDGTYSYFQQPNIEITPSISKKETYKDIEVVDTEDIKTQTGEIGAASYDRKNKVIKINRNLLQKKFEEKAWTKPRKQKDDSFAKALDENIFPIYKDFENFVIEHEFQHSLLSREEFDKLPENKDKKTTTGEYEDYINTQALKELGFFTPEKEEIPTEEQTQEDGVGVEDKKADIERRKGLNGVEEIIFSNPNFKLEGFEIDGNYWNVVTSTDRAKVLVNVNGVIVPFYLTTGQAGKGLVPGWYPFFGIGKDGWLNKTDKSDMETYYERYWGKETADIVKSISEELNGFYGTDPSAFKNDGDPNTTSRPLTTLADKVEDYINSKLNYTPAINNADARKTLRSNVEQLGKEINAKYDAELDALEQPKEEKEEIVIQPTTEQQLVEKSKELTETDVTSLDDIISSLDNELGKIQTDFQLPSTEGQIASEKTIRDLAARMADRIGIPIRFESDRTKEYKGKIENGVAYINLAYATLDTPIHEILGHPIIRAIRNRKLEDGSIEEVNTFMADYWDAHPEKSREEVEKYVDENFKPTIISSQLYENLLKELESGRGKEVLDRIKRDYQQKSLPLPVTNKYGVSLDELIETGISRGESAEQISNFINKHFKSEDGEYFYFNYSNNYEPEFPGDEAPRPQTTKSEVESLLHKDIKGEPITVKYTLEEQQEEAIVELLGLMTAEKLDAVKDGKLISLLKRLFKEMKQFVRSLLNQKEVEIDKLPDNMTLGDLSDLLAYSNSKLILPGYEVQYTTPDNQQFKTYQEASNHIAELAKNVKDVDLSSVSLDINKNNNPYNLVHDEPYYTSDSNFLVFVNSDKISHYRDFPEYKNLEKGNYYEYKFIPSKYNYEFVKVTTARVQQLVDNNPGLYIGASNELKNANLDKIGIKNFIDKNKEYEQSKEIIEEWKKVNNIQYNPEEIYSRGQEFSSVVGAYSSFDVNLMMQNLLQHIEDNEKAGGKFAISAYTKPIDKQIGHLEGGGGKIKFKLYPQSEDILWAANTDVYSGSVWDASEKVNKDKKSELLGVSYTKFPALRNINSVQPNLASIVDDLAHHHNELGIVLTGNNFRIEYDEDIPYQTKKIIDANNAILDQKYGKLDKPEIKSRDTSIINKKDELRLNEIDNLMIKLSADYNKGLITLEEVKQLKEPLKRERRLLDLKRTDSAIQPTQTKETLKESIDSVKKKLNNLTPEQLKELNDKIENGEITDEEEYNAYIFDNLDKINKKEYTSQALINTKIAALKEVAKKYPRSLIRSEVKRINTSSSQELYDQFGADELPFQKIPNNTEKNVTFVTKEDLNKLDKGKPCK